MSIHEHLPPQARRELKELGWTKGRELAKLARRDGQHFECAPWVHKARSMPREVFRREVEKELTGREEEPSELIYFKVEMICADFLAGAHLDNEFCGTMSNLEVHHKQFRSHSGDDSEENLITLCAACHAIAHRPETKLIGREPVGSAALRGERMK